MMSSDGSGSTGSRPWRIRANAASIDGDAEVSARACSTVGGHDRFETAPQVDTAVRKASIGLVVGGSVRRTVRTSGGTGPVVIRCAGSQSPVHSRLATAL